MLWVRNANAGLVTYALSVMAALHTSYRVKPEVHKCALNLSTLFKIKILITMRNNNAKIFPIPFMYEYKEVLYVNSLDL